MGISNVKMYSMKRNFFLNHTNCCITKKCILLFQQKEMFLFQEKHLIKPLWVSFTSWSSKWKLIQYDLGEYPPTDTSSPVPRACCPDSPRRCKRKTHAVQGCMLCKGRYYRETDICGWPFFVNQYLLNCHKVGFLAEHKFIKSRSTCPCLCHWGRRKRRGEGVVDCQWLF